MAEHPGLSALREQGAHRFDPVRFRHLEALARRAAAHAGPLTRFLEGRLEQAVAAYRVAWDEARGHAARALDGLALQFPDAALELRRLHAEGDLPGLRRLARGLETRTRPGPLGALVGEIDRHASTPGAAGADPAPTAFAYAPWVELKGLRDARGTWIRLSNEQRLSRAMAQAPENPGPLNSHRLVLQSLRVMQDLSPAYLQRFMAHVEALLWLDAAQTAGAATPGPSLSSRPSPRRAADRPRKPGRGR